MLSKQFTDKVREKAEKEGLVYEQALSSAIMWWTNAHICPLGIYVEDMSEYLAGIPLEEFASSDNSEESDAVVRFGIMSFTDFWKRYDFSRGSKPSARKKFKALKKKELHAIDQTLHIYKAETYTYSEVKGKRQRKQAEFYLSGKLWIATQEAYSKVSALEPKDQNLQDIFAKLRIDVPYIVAPNIDEVRERLERFKLEVEYNERVLIGSLQEFYDNKGIYAGKLANVLSSLDFQSLYLSNMPKK